MRTPAVLLLALAACSPTPEFRFERLQQRSERIGHSAGPPPHHGYSYAGRFLLKEAPEGLGIDGNSVPRRISGAGGIKEFLPKRSSVRIVDGWFYFHGLIGDDSWGGITGLTDRDPEVRVDFETPNGIVWTVRGRIEVVTAEHPFHPDLAPAADPLLRK